jgi:hypothetical protein
MTKIPLRQFLSHFPLDFFVAQSPEKLLIHHPKVNPYRSA